VIGGAGFALAMIWFFLAEWWTQRRARRALQQALSVNGEAPA